MKDAIQQRAEALRKRMEDKRPDMEKRADALRARMEAKRPDMEERAKALREKVEKKFGVISDGSESSDNHD